MPGTQSDYFQKVQLKVQKTCWKSFYCTYPDFKRSVAHNRLLCGAVSSFCIRTREPIQTAYSTACSSPPDSCHLLMGIAIVFIEFIIPWREMHLEGGLKGVCLIQEEVGFSDPVPGMWFWKALLPLRVPLWAALHPSGCHSEILPFPKLDTPLLLHLHSLCLMAPGVWGSIPQAGMSAHSPPSPHFQGLAGNLPIRCVKQSKWTKVQIFLNYMTR